MEINQDKDFVILITEDEDDVREILADQTTQPGFQVVQATNGQEGFDVLQKQKVDLVITDLNMPKMNGLEFLQKAKSASFKMPFIILTGHGNQDVAKRARLFGVYDFINKPWDPAQLEKIIRKALKIE
ncbi:MAG: response regulator [Pseudobdellovibrionaceae bacterium]